MKQTAVEWIVEQIKSNWHDIEYGEIDIDDLLEQAKKMEKDQIINSFSEGTKMIDVNDELSAIFNGIIYYDENYKQ